MNKVLLWVQQPTSVAGISAIAGTVSAVSLHQLTFAAAVPLIAAALVSIALPDNTGAKAAAESLTRELTTKILSQEKK